VRAAAPLRPAAGAAASILLALALAACSPCGGDGDNTAPAEPSACAGTCENPACILPGPALPRTEGEFTVLTFNLDHWTLEDRDGDPSTLEPKPAAETDAIIQTLRTLSPDVILVQEMGGNPVELDGPFDLLLDALEYPHTYHAFVDPDHLDLAILSRIPLDPVSTATNDLYTIGPRKFPVRRGILDATLRFPNGTALRLFGVHLKSKKFHEFGQAEMRRNEARLLCNRVRSALKSDPATPILVLGDFNDTPSSAPLQEILTYQNKPILTDLRPTDNLGDAWTYRAEDDACLRHDYALASATLLPYYLPQKTYIPSAPALSISSDHRPLFLTFRIPDPATPPPALPSIPSPRSRPSDD
jgi:endonuclease/exonuclease/phosphatase family metal-dependent hydrolase